jgi:hypothetical protein
MPRSSRAGRIPGATAIQTTIAPRSGDIPSFQSLLFRYGTAAVNPVIRYISGSPRSLSNIKCWSSRKNCGIGVPLTVNTGSSRGRQKVYRPLTIRRTT